MLYPIAIEIGDTDVAYGVAFPDLAGCFSAGDTLEEALSNAKEAAEMYLEDLAERGKLPPQAGDLATWQKDPEYQGWAWAVVDVDIEPYMGKAAKINVTLPTLVTKRIDDIVKQMPEYKSRSNFLQIAAMRELARSKEHSESAA
ncbi:type II toxin-antitoxin system HicB family antitoxin [Shewanella dokdonensis]|jgi:predicted RNase H-like HicB family nuclease|uniref:Type II toxin-antitoxin system HicB family antitoxin n=1 Tax=Shewanella dokdonensis TaxID=712036 RepID=A0ABX8DBY2_9GAMM|nr:type II toxin-antitoxin system HicB family antitoxin [Shewanella dokdonensis]MCL1075510.1 type II toxin-antitoxin system HicB family antitoxin [Shewanella dokdonensis]QVK22186.1 type II toxin-antitoxin system HicB family antitoxin [Shewanella dokdonensis]